MSRNPTREEAWAILTEHVKSPSLLSHALAVEAVMRHVARKRSADEELWGVIGLIRPSRSVLDLPVKSVLKKWKDKGVVPLDQLIADTIEGMKTVAETIGLKGNPDISPSA